MTRLDPAPQTQIYIPFRDRLVVSTHTYFRELWMDPYSPDRPFVTLDQMQLFDAIDRDTARTYGPKVRAAGISNIDYKVRFSQLGSSQNMKPPPSCGRIYPGYIVVRQLGTPEQYETWMPNHVFEELYRAPSER